jgi:diguanylate cyclase (GGDEF)-like protein
MRTQPGSGNEGEDSLNSGPELPNSAVMRLRVGLGLVLGIAGIALGVVGAVFNLAVLTIVAAACAVVGCFLIAGVTLLPLISANREPAEQLGSRIDAVTSSVDFGSGDRTKPTGESVIDSVTELPDGRFFEVAVEGRVAAARRHLWPVSIVLLQLGFDRDNNSEEVRNKSLVSFANMMRQTLREADIACRIDENTFGLILEDTSEEGGVWTAERLQIALSHEVTNIRRLVAGVAAYPTHGLFSKDVLGRARAALSRASSTPTGQGLGQVEVAHVDL